MTKPTAALGVLIASHSLVAAQSIPFSQGNLSFVTSTLSSSSLTLPPFPVRNTTSSSVSAPLSGSGTSSILSRTEANLTTAVSVTTSSATVPSDSFTTSPGTPVSSQNVGTTSLADQRTANSSSQTVSLNSTGSPSTTVITSDSNPTVSKSFSSTSILVPGNGTLPFPTTTLPGSLSEDDAPVAATFTGAWKDTSSLTPVSFTWFNIPTMTISDAPEETSESKLLGGLLFALRANRKWLQDSKLKVQYIDNVKKTQDEITALFSKLSIKPPTVPGCSGGKRKRGALSEVQLRALLRNRGIIPDIGKAIKGAIGDTGKLISCAYDVVTQLTKAIEGIEGNTPDLGEIEDLTDTLAEIGKDLEDENEDEESSSTSQQSSTTSEASSSSSSSTSCTGSTAIPICTEIVSLSTSFMSGATSTSTVTTITQTSCITRNIPGCTEIGTTTTTAGSTSSASSLSVSASQEVYYYGSDSEAAVTLLASKIESEQANLGCVTNWNQPTPTAGCNLSGLKWTTPANSVSLLTIPDLNELKSSLASATGPMSSFILSPTLNANSTLRVSASATSLNSSPSISSTMNVNTTIGTPVSASGSTLTTYGSSSSMDSILFSSSSTADQKDTTSASRTSDTKPTSSSSTPVSGQSVTNSASSTSEASSTIIGSASSAGQVESNSASSVSNPNSTPVSATSTSVQGERTSTLPVPTSSRTVVGSISNSGQSESTSALSLSGATSTPMSSTSTTTGAKTASQSSSMGVPSTLITAPSSTSLPSLPSDTLLTSSSRSTSSLPETASSSQTSSLNTNSGSLSTSQITLTTSQSGSISTSSSSTTLDGKITVSQDTIHPEPTLTPANCRGLNNNNYISRDLMELGIKDFCEYAGVKNKHDDNSGSIATTFWGATIQNATNFWIDWPQGVSLQEDECLRNMNSIMDNCDGVPSNPGNWKHGGNITYGQFTYHIEPTFDRGYLPGSCAIEFTADMQNRGYQWDVNSVTFTDNAQIARVKPPNDFSLSQQDDGPSAVKIMTLSHGDLNITLTPLFAGSELLFTYGTTNWTLFQNNCEDIDTNVIHKKCSFTC